MRHLSKLPARRLSIAAVILVALGAVAGAWAYFSATGTGTAHASAGVVNPPTNVGATATNSTVAVSWTASVTGGGAVSPQGYYVTRTNTSTHTTSAACGSSASSLVTGTSCSDTTVPNGSYTYTVVAVYRSWTAQASSSPVQVAASLDHFVITVPVSATAGSPFSATVVAKDASGNTVVGYLGTIHFTSTDGQSILPSDYTFTSSDSGSHTFSSGVTLKTSGNQSLSVNDTVKTTATGTASVGVGAGTVSTLAFTSAPVSGTASASASLGPVTVAERDAYGNPTTTAETVSLSSTSVNGVFSATQNGTATTSVSIAAGASSTTFYYGDKTAGSPTITASAGGLTSATQSETVTAGAASSVSVVSGSSQTATINTAFGAALLAKVTDAFGNPVSNATVTFAAPSTGASGSFATCASGNPASYACVVTTNASGVATSSTLTANGTVGSYSVSASATGASSASFSMTNQKINQTISFTSTAPTNATVGGPTYSPTATASSGLSVTLSIDASATSVCSLSGSTVSFTATGTCVIDANQAGNGTYNAAPQVQQSVTVGRGALTAVAYTGADGDVWAVGAGCTLLWSSSTSKWTPFTAPSSCASANLTGVFIQGAGAGWAVGAGGTVLACTANCQTPASGATWTTVSPSALSALNLSGVWASAANTVYVVGTTTAGAGQIWACSANCSLSTGTWTNVTPSGGLASTNLNSVAGTTNGGAYVIAVGSGGTVETCNVGTCATSASGWAKTTLASTANLTSVVGFDQNHAVAVGSVAGTGKVFGCSGSCGTNSATWTDVTPGTSALPPLNGVSGGAANAVWAVGNAGTVLFCSGNACQTASSAWSNVSNDPTNKANNTVPTSANLLATTADTSNDGWAVGSGNTIISSNNIGPVGGMWGVEGSGTVTTLNSVAYAGSGTNLWSVGNGCTLLWSTTTNGWTPFTAPSGCNSANLTAAAVLDAGHGWAVGSGGTVLFCSANCNAPASGATWTAINPSALSAMSLSSVWASAANVVYAVGTNTGTGTGQIWACSANCNLSTGTWTNVTPSGLSVSALTSVEGTTAAGAYVLVVGSGGTVEFCTTNCATSATGWSKPTTLPSGAPNLSTVVASDATHALAVGTTSAGAGKIWGCSASCSAANATWTDVTPAGLTSTGLTGVTFGTSSDAWAVGNGGAVLFCPKTASCLTATGAWTNVSTDPSNQTNGTPPTTANLLATTGVTNNDGSGWAVGSGGTIISSQNIAPFQGGIWGLQYP